MFKFSKRIIAFLLVYIICISSFNGLMINNASAVTSVQHNNFGWLWPVPDNFSLQRGFYSKKGNIDGHKGIDIYADFNTPIVAAYEGEIVKIFNVCEHDGPGSVACNCGEKFGNGLIIKHNINNTCYYTLYGHMIHNSIPSDLKIGTKVKKGDKIGEVGTAGNSTISHLHFSIVEYTKENSGGSPWYHGQYLNNNPINNNKKHNYKLWGGKTKTHENYVEAINYSYDLYFSKNTFSNAKTVKIKENKAYIRKEPYKSADCVYTKSLNETITIIASYNNLYGNLWYETEDGYWIYSERITEETSKKVEFKKTSSSQKKVESKVQVTTTVTKFPSPTVVVENSTYVIPGPAPVAEGYTFLGYSKDENSQTAEYQIGDSLEISNDIILYPVWKQTATTMEISSYNQSFDISTGDKSSTLDISCKGELKKTHIISVISDNNTVATATVSNKTYKNHCLWDSLTAELNITAKSGGTANLLVLVTDSSNKTLIAKTVYVSVNESFNIDYYVDNIKTKSQTKKFDKTLELLNYTPEKNNYSFMGWTTVSGTTTVEYGPGDLYKNNVGLSLYAIWEENVRIDAPNWNDTTKTLTITGKGDMPCYPSGKIPWADYTSLAENLVISSGITSIGSNAFSCFSKLKKVTLPNGIVKICNNAFSKCQSLSEINIPSTVSVIGSRAFSNCSELQKALLPQSDVLVTASLEPDLESDLVIGAYAFENCISLASIEMPNNISELGAGAFSGCTSLEKVTISEGLNTIEDNTFFNCSNIESVDIPNNIVVIGDGAFSGCSSTQEIVISEGVEEIGDQAFSGCSALEEVAVPSSIETIGAGVFSACSNLNDVELPDNLNYVGDAMFSNCSTLSTINLPEGIEYIGDGAFRDCSALTKITIPDSVNFINADTFWGCSALEEISLPYSIMSIGDYAFCSCEALTNIELNEGLKSVGLCAFAFCSSLEEIAFPATVTNIDICSFIGCASLKNVEILESSVSIGDYAFNGCMALEEIYLPEGTVSLGNDVFTDCSSSMKITCFSSSSIYEQVTDTYNNIDLIVPVNSITLDYDAVSIDIGNSLELSHNIYPINATCKDVTWKSDNEAVVTVDSSGKISAVSGGTATITVTSIDGLFTASCFVSVNVPVEGIKLNYNSNLAYIGDEFKLNYKFLPENPTNLNVSWNSSNENIATVDEEGLIKIVGEGTVYITITTEDGSYCDTCQLNCSKYIEVTEIKLDKYETILSPGETTIISAQCFPKNATNKLTQVIVENTDIVSADEDGNILALNVGTTSVYITIDECISDICKVTVLEKHSHSYSAVITAPTCTENGYTTKTCSCGNSYKTDYTNPTGHSFSKESFSWNENHTSCNLIVPCQKCTYQDVTSCNISKEEIKPTCVLDGKTIYMAVCIYGGKTYSNTIEEKSRASLGHRFVEGECEICHICQEEATLSDAKTLAIYELNEARKNFVSDEANVEIDNAILIIENTTEPENVIIAKSNGLIAADNAEKALETAKLNAISDVETATAVVKSYEAKSILESAKNAINSATNINSVNTEKNNAIVAANIAEEAYEEKIKYDNIIISVPNSVTIDYRSLVTITATATNVPTDCKLVMCINSKEYVVGNKESISYFVGEIKSNVNYNIKIIDKDGNIIKNSRNEIISKDGGKITCKAGFFQKLVAFFKGLFKTLPVVFVEP